MEVGALLVMADNMSGWADLGNQARVIDTLDRNKIEPDWLREMRRPKVAAQPRAQLHVGQELGRALIRNVATA
jgi:hypothetical protein